MPRIITLSSHTTSAAVSPLGGTALYFKVNSVDILFPERIIEMPVGPKKRGGIPILFPNAGPLAENETFTLKQHGFARTSEWRVTESTNTKATLVLESNDETRSQFPFDFTVTEILEVSDNELLQILQIENKSDKPMPVAPGLHHYFAVPHAQKQKIQTNIEDFSASDYDWVTAVDKPLPHPLTVTTQAWELTMETSSEFTNCKVWSEAGRDYVCFEPWIGKDGALLNENEHLVIQPGETKELTLRMRVKA